MATRRLFFALWPTEPMQAALADAARATVASADGAAVPPRNFHFTLAFLGSVDESRIGELNGIGTRVAAAFQSIAGAAPLAITLDRSDYWRKSQILCATSSVEPAEAIALAETLKRVLTENGFAPDLEPFRAHATLARKVRRATREHELRPVQWSFTEFALVASQLGAQGSVYEVVATYPFS